MDISRICFNCMKGEVDEDGVCNECGKQFSDIKLSENYLPVGSFLRDKYLMGRVLGEGGFGITYIGYDINLDAQVAIKEFFPRNYCSRARGASTVIPNEGDAEVFFGKQRDRFLDEAKRLAKFRNTPAIVSVLDFFKDNGTAYIVMNYIDGTTLRDLLETSGERISVEETLKIIEPVMIALKEIHENGFIHRDISPDNIMLSNLSNRVYLIDFGTARSNSGDEEKTISVFKKSGYTPPEQLRTKGKQGPWTDVYALCGTIYRCITGVKPLDVTDRLFGEKLKKPSEYGIRINPVYEDAIMKGLEVHNDNRFQSIEELYNTIYKSDAWKDAGDEEYTKVVEAVRNYKLHGNPIPKIEQAYREKEKLHPHASTGSSAEAESAASPATPSTPPVLTERSEREKIKQVVGEYKKTPEYKEDHDKAVKEDPDYKKLLDEMMARAAVENYKNSQGTK